MKVLHFPAQRIALVLVFALLNQTFFPTIAWALTSGPTQPEVSSFTPASTSDMVDLFSGDFQYNIPLLDVGGYPINISYAAGPGMDEEASWVGLGWNLNPGVINRQMRGIPDDFRGDTIYKAFNMRPDVTTGITVGGGLEIKGLPLKLNASLGMYYNTYRGYGIISGISPVLSVANFSKGGLTAGLGLHYDSQNGLDISPYLGMKQKIGRTDFSLSNSITMNSRRGLRDLSISYNTSIKDPNKFQRNLQKAFGAGGSSISFSGSTYTPTSELPLINKSFTFHGTVGFENTTINPNAFLDGYRSEQKLLRNREKQASFGYLHSQLAKPSDVLDFNRERQGLPWREHMPVLPPAFGTNDLFSASGQGSAGQFRAIRSDIGFYRDAFHTNESDSKSFGVELGFAPNLVKVGADVNETTVNAYSKGWTENNPLAKTTGYTDWDGISVYEPVFFKNSGEMTISDTAFFAKVGRTSPVQADLEKTTGAIRTAFQFSSNQKPSGKTTFNISPTIQRTEREKRNDVWQFLTGKEASKHGLEKKIISYKRGSGQIRLSKDATNCAIDSVLSRTKYKGHHISEVIVLKPDGARYVYGVPAYNTYQKEVSFSVSESTVDDGTGLMQYDTIQKDNSIYNRRGRDQY
ncbi:MAG: hypothetical protein KA479_14110, partial [Saprospiraceae bacterium]|nr:hypothetical protein [Saprospiraceae bacterium]